MTDSESPRFTLFSIFRQASWRKTPGACLFLSVLIVLYGLILLKLWVPAWQQRGMAQFHLTVNTYPEWFLLQPVPAMYNYGNEIWIGDRPRRSVPGHLTAPKYREYYTWLNHYPLRIVSFSWTRDVIVREKGYKYITLRSRYRGSFLETGYYLRVADGRVHMERIY